LAFIAKPLDYFIASRLVKLDYLGLSNIMFTKFNKRAIHPEFIQDNVTPENLVRSFKEYDSQNFLEDSKKLRGYLVSGSSANVAKLIQES
jgi:lipid-A-disaccharide synthase